MLSNPQPLDVKRTYRWLLDESLRNEFMMREEPDIKTHICYWRKILNNHLDSKFFSIYHSNKHVGNCGIKNISPGRSGEVWIYIGDSSMKGLGVGKCSMIELMNVAREKGLVELYLHVRSDNVPANRLYEQLGFKKTRVGDAKSFGFEFQAEVSLMKVML